MGTEHINDNYIIELDAGGSVEIDRSPEHINLIGERNGDGCELRLLDHEKNTLADLLDSGHGSIEVAEGYIGVHRAADQVVLLCTQYLVGDVETAEFDLTAAEGRALAGALRTTGVG